MTEMLKGKYSLDACIGRGGMAEVFSGRTVGKAGFSQRVAIKRIHPIYSLDAGFRAMFTAEAQLSSHLQHSNIVRVFDFDEDEAGCLFLVMEYVDGVDLDGLLGTGLLPLPVVLFVTSEILRGLAYVHELPLVEGGPRGLVHRDVSPQNVLLSWDGAVRVSDFGIAKARTATQAGASVTIKGKPAYMSPEQAGGRALDGRSDVFAVGIMLWEMLCGEPLFHDPNDMRTTLAAVMFGDAPPPSLRARRPIPDDVERATMQMLRRDREERHDAAGALAALTACADYPTSGREVLAALLPERLPARAPRRGAPRLPRSQPPWERVTVRCSVGADPQATPIALPRERHTPRPRHDRRSVKRRARRATPRTVLLGSLMVGALIGVTLHVVIRRNFSSAAAQGAPVLPAPNPPDAVEHVRASDAPRVEPAAATGLGSLPLQPSRGPAAAPLKSGGAAPERTDRPRREDVGPIVRSPRAPALAPVPPPARSGMGIIDLRPDTPAPGSTGRSQHGTREIELGPANE